ncbi:MAG: DNA-directed RNA polymerase subunit beta [Streptococcaceae bacterium]|nr:DNA-directed RNA polymerase subunit beta [Streptococcaceae bacterium]
MIGFGIIGSSNSKEVLNNNLWDNVFSFS